MDRKQGKRPIPSDHVLEMEDFNFSGYPTPSENQKEEASPSPFSHVRSTRDSTLSIPISHGQISTSELTAMQDPSQPIDPGKLLSGSFPSYS